MVLNLCTLSDHALYCTKFRKNINKGLRVTYVRTDKGKTICLFLLCGWGIHKENGKKKKNT